MYVYEQVRELCGEGTRGELDPSKSPRLRTILSHVRHLDAAFDHRRPSFDQPTGGQPSSPAAPSFEETLRARSRLLFSLSLKLELREHDSDLDYLSQAARAVLLQHSSPHLSVPLPLSLALTHALPSSLSLSRSLARLHLSLSLSLSLARSLARLRVHIFTRAHPHVRAHICKGGRIPESD